MVQQSVELVIHVGLEQHIFRVCFWVCKPQGTAMRGTYRLLQFFGYGKHRLSSWHDYHRRIVLQQAKGTVRAAPNATRQARLKAGARHERALEAVACTRLILIEASPLSIPRWYAGAGKTLTHE